MQSDPYDSTAKIDALELTGLGNDALWDAIQSLVNDSNSARRLGAAHRAQIMAQLRELDPSGRPLFAALFADAVAANRDSRHWDRRALVQDVLRREEHEYWKNVGVTAAEKDLLALATSSGGIDLTRDDLPQLIEERLKPEVFSPERYRLISGRRSDVFLAPLEPDILGERSSRASRLPASPDCASKSPGHWQTRAKRFGNSTVSQPQLRSSMN